DAESDLDYFGERYCSSSAGRFTSVDPGASYLLEPQSLNRYIYANNSPLSYVDPDGEKWRLPKRRATARALQTDQRLLTIMVLSNNYSPAQFEDDLDKGALNNLFGDSGVGSILRGLAGEAYMADAVESVGGVIEYQPTDLEGCQPDLKAVYPAA